MNRDLIIYVDFDSTLYETDIFGERLWRLIATRANLPVDTVKRDSAAYCFHPYLGGYSYEAHCKRYGLDTEAMWKALDTITDSADYLYSDSVPFIHSLWSDGFAPHILTFGEQRFQLAKIQPMLRYFTNARPANTIEITVVDKKKHLHIARLHAGQRGVLVDDKPDQALPEGFVEIHLDRTGTRTEAKIKGRVIHAANLTQARDAIRSLPA